MVFDVKEWQTLQWFMQVVHLNEGIRWLICEKFNRKKQGILYKKRFLLETETQAFSKWKELTGETL